MENQKIMDRMKVIAFRLKDQEYGVDVNQVNSIERLHGVTKVPKTVDFIKGIINLRGEVTPVINLAERFGMGESESTENSRIIIVNLGQMQAGLIVDSANDVIDIPTDMIEPPPQILHEVHEEFVHGVAKLDNSLLVIVNLNKILGENEIEQLKEIQ